MYEFEYQKPASLDDAARRLSDEDAKLVAGGMTLIPTLKLRLAKPTQLIDLAAIPSLKGISEEGDAVVIGAMTRHADVNRSAVVKSAIPALAALAGMIGDPAVRNRGTIGGSIANNDPAADYPAAIVGLNATVRTNKREIPADSLFPCVFRVPAMEAALAANFSPDAIKDITIPDTDLNSDIHASAEYRAHLVTVMARRAVAACA